MMRTKRLRWWIAAGWIGAVGFLGGVVGSSDAARKRGGDMVFAQEAQVPNLDMHFSSAIATRNIAMHIVRGLLTRDESNAPIAELAERWAASPDGLTYTFPLRKGVLFHNGKEMTSADVLASFERYQKVGVDRKMLDQVVSMTAPEKYSFQLKLKRAVPTFIEELSSFRVPIVIMPAEETAKPAGKTEPYVGTGPYQFVEWVPDSHVKLKRFDRYKVNEALPGPDGLRRAQARLVRHGHLPHRDRGRGAGGRAREGRVPGRGGRANQGGPATPAQQEHRALPARAVLDPHRHPQSRPGADRTTSWCGGRSRSASTWKRSWRPRPDGAYKLQPGYQYPGNPYYTDAGKERYNVNDKEQAKRLLREAGYKGEELVLITNTDYQNMYNAALVMAEQLKAIGMTVKIEVSDWPTVRKKQQDKAYAWNIYFTGFGTGPAVGASGALLDLIPPTALQHTPGDPVFQQAYEDMLEQADARGAQGGVRPRPGPALRAGPRHQVRRPHQGPGGPEPGQGLQAVPDPAALGGLVRGIAPPPLTLTLSPCRERGE